MIRVTRRRVLLAVLALFLFGVGYVAWTLAGLPPVKYYLRYGLDPHCEPTGNKEICEGVEFIEIGPGIFRMGSAMNARGGDWLGRLCTPLGLPWGDQPEPSREMPTHWVEFPAGFWIAKTEVTFEQFARFDPSYWPGLQEQSREDDTDYGVTAGTDGPVVCVAWGLAKRYCDWLSRATGKPVRLPTEAEWECACRAGNSGDFCFGDDPGELAAYAWFAKNSGGRVHRVGTRAANQWGIHDMHGSVMEWCEDLWHWGYEGAPAKGEAWMVPVHVGEDYHIARGGDWHTDARRCRSAEREWLGSNCQKPTLGFRPAFVQVEE